MLSNNMLIVPNNKLVSSLLTNFYLPEPGEWLFLSMSVWVTTASLEKVERVTAEVAKQVLQETEGGGKRI